MSTAPRPEGATVPLRAPARHRRAELTFYSVGTDQRQRRREKSGGDGAIHVSLAGIVRGYVPSADDDVRQTVAVRVAHRRRKEARNVTVRAIDAIEFSRWCGR